MNIFRLRVKKQWQLNSKLIKSIVDWTVLLYLLIPVALFLYYFYRETVLKGDFGILEVVPLPIIVFLLLLFTSGGYVRSFVEPADRLFLIQHQHTFRKLKAYSFIYSLSKKSVMVGILLLLLSVVFIQHYGLHFSSLINIGIVVLISNIVNTLIHLRFNRKVAHFFLNFGQLILFTIMVCTLKEPLSTAIYITMFILLFILYWIKYVRTTKHLDKQTDLEIQSYYKWQSMIFAVSPELKSMRASKLPVKSPFLFNDRLFKKDEDFLLDLIGKTFLRQKKYILAYSRLVLVIVGLTFALPFWADFALAGVSYFMLKGWVQSLVFEIKGHPIFGVYQVEDIEWIQTENMLSKYLVGSPIILLVLIIGITEILI